MAEVVRMPLLSDTMKEGVIAEWHKKVGDIVASDDVLAEVETDKATMEVMPYVDGTLLYISDKKAIPVNGILAIIGEAGEDISGLLDDDSATKEKESVQPEQVKAPEQNNQLQDAAPKVKSAVELPTTATVVNMPLLSDTMKEGKIVAWLKNIGDTVASDDVIAEVETDKATMEVMPYADGVLLYQGVPAGGAVAVNGILAIVGEAGTDIQPFLDNKSGNDEKVASESTDKPAEPATKPKAQEIKPTVPTANVVAEQDNKDASGRVKISPLAKKIADDKGIDIQNLQGTGDGGRIVKRDLDNYKPETIAPKASKANSVATTTGEESFTDVPLTQMRKVIAARLSESMFNAPHFYLRSTIKMDNAMAARTAMNAVSESKISFNDLIIKAAAISLRKHPAVNSSWMGDFIRTNHHISIGTAVAIEEGLMVPVIKFADTKSLSAIAAESKILVKKARDKKLQPQEFTGNTFTISNLGMMDIDDFTAIINPPDSCILAVGKIEETPVVENGEIVIRNLLRLTLSCDHRVVDGALGAAFLQTLKSYLEAPVTMLV